MCQTAPMMGPTMGETSESSGGKPARALSRSARAVAGLPVRIFAVQESAFGIIQDFSCSGMLVRTQHLAEVGSHCTIQVDLPDQGELELRCRVVRGADTGGTTGDSAGETTGDTKSAAMGLCFEDQQDAIDTNKMQRLGQLLADIRALANAIARLDNECSTTGTLSKTPLAPLLSCLDAESITGMLRLETTVATGVIRVQAGRVIDFRSEGTTTLSGEQSLQELLRCDRGEFVFQRRAQLSAAAPGTRVIDLLWRHVQELSALEQ